MTSPSSDTSNNLVIEENIQFPIDHFEVTILSYLGLLTADVHYFQVELKVVDNTTISSQLGLLRVGAVDGGLSREMKLRETLGNYGMIVPLLAHTIKKSVLISPNLILNNQEPQELIIEDGELTTETTLVLTEEDVDALTDEIENNEVELHSESFEYISDDYSRDIETEVEYLEEEYYPEKEIATATSQEKLLILTAFPEKELTLAYWLEKQHSLEDALARTIQICQFCSHLSQKQWCIVNFIPELIQVGKPIKFFDLTNAYPANKRLSLGFIGDYCAPELAIGTQINEMISTYSIGVLLYQCLHQKLPQVQQKIEIKPIPLIAQIIKICFYPLTEDRFSLSQLLSFLFAARQDLRKLKINWKVATKTTVGLSPIRLHNEDSYGFRQKQNGDLETIILGMVADGMGGMVQGEVASQIAVKTVLEVEIPINLKTEEEWNKWLIALVETINKTIAEQVYNGGTTLSLVLGINNKLMIAHVGDSRIYLLRKNTIIQLSEDHSLAAMLVASGQITKAEGVKHPQRNMLTKYLGSKNLFTDDYMQDLRLTREALSLQLEDQDILLLCSDGVWDLVTQDELLSIFTKIDNLQLAVDETINQVLQKGAPDNATLLALQCQITPHN